MLEHRQVPVADVDGTYHVAIMWPKKEAPNLKNILFSRTHLQHRARISIHAYTFF